MREPSDGEVLASLPERELERLLELVPAEVELVSDPVEGMLLLTCREGLGQRFHLGEVLVTSCRVDWAGVPGWSMVAGGDARRALAGAVLDAARRAVPAPASLEAMLGILEGNRRKLAEAREEESRRSAATRVEFDLMPGG